MSEGVHRLPTELWRLVIRHATSTENPISETREYTLNGQDAIENKELPCLKDDAPLTPVLYHRKGKSRNQSAIESFTQAGTKSAIALVCRTLNQVVGEFLFEKFYISDPSTAHRLADTLENSAFYADRAGKWTRHITIVGVFFTWPAASGELASAALRILARTPHLRSFHLSWNATSREFRDRESQIIAAVPTASLRYLEWDCTGGGFERQNDHPIYRLLRRAGPTLRVLKLSGYLPLAELPIPPPPSPSEGFPNNEAPATTSLPALTHLKIRRAFRDDLLFVSQWAVSTHLTCLSLGSIWAYFDRRELAFSFFDTPKPALKCLHLGEGSNVCPQLARKILRNAPRLKTLDYFYLGDWDARTWTGVRHDSLETVKIHISHPFIALRSPFNSQRFTRDQQWDRILRHVSPFLGCVPAIAIEDGDEDLRSAGGPFPGPEDEGTSYSAMKRLVLLEYARKFEDLRYEPVELAEWLRTTIRDADINTDVELLVEVEDYIR